MEVLRRSRISVWLVFILLGLTSVVVYRQVFWLTPLFDRHAEPRAITPRGDLAADELSTIELFREVAPSVVHITAVTQQQHAVTMNVLTIPAGTGSGFVWDNKGHIVTNLHVILEASGATVTLADNSNWPAQVVGVDRANDLAVLKIDAEPVRLKPIAVGTSHDLQVGQRVFAIGSPFEFDHTLTTGIISGLNRGIGTPSGLIHGAIQSDAAINPGNSGGPLLDSAGRLIGVNTAIATESGGSQGVGFSVPVDIVNSSVPDLIQDGRISLPWLGIVFQERTGPLSGGLPGVPVQIVIEGSPAHRAGILPMRRIEGSGGLIPGDILLKIDNTVIQRGRDIMDYLGRRKPGDTVKLTLNRNGQLIGVSVVLESLPVDGPQ